VVRCLTLGVCQVVRRCRKIDLGEWEQWLEKSRSEGLVERLRKENTKIRVDLAKFAAKLDQTQLSLKMVDCMKNRDWLL